jgi:hypothetical protein
MSITSAKSGATGISLALDNNYMEPIASTLVGAGGVSTIAFTDIPQTYKHLQLRIFAQSNRATFCRDSIEIRYNNDYATNYSSHVLYGDGGSVAASGSANDNGNSTGTIGTSVENTGKQFGIVLVDILDYANTNKHKTLRLIGGEDMNGTGASGIGGIIQIGSGMWMNTNPITSIQFEPGVGTLFTQYTRISLYGIKG